MNWRTRASRSRLGRGVRTLGVRLAPTPEDFTVHVFKRTPAVGDRVQYTDHALRVHEAHIVEVIDSDPEGDLDAAGLGNHISRYSAVVRIGELDVLANFSNQEPGKVKGFCKLVEDTDHAPARDR